MSNFIDLTGQKFNKLLVLERVPNQGKKVRWKCQCDCGNIIEVNGSNLRTGHTKSCGCISKENCSQLGKQNKINLLGETYGDLTVLKEIQSTEKGVLWECQCKCGNKINLTTYEIRSGRNNFSCGCKSLQNKKLDLIGQHFGKLIVLQDTNKRTDKGNVIWKCQCECGNIIEVPGNSLTSGNTQSCGCVGKQKLIENNKKRYIDLTNQRFGKLVALERIEDSNTKKMIWKCQCDCGNITYIPTSDLTSGNTKSCGCGRSQSYGENKIENILKENNINYIKEYSNPTCRFNETEHLARFDFYLQDLNTIIEYDGQQHTIIGTGKYDSLEKVKQTQERDKFKNQWCKDNNITLIRIPYTHYQDIQLEDLLPETSKFIV